jgi:pimeloyl-ACP methyl ester carboxylesterase
MEIVFICPGIHNPQFTREFCQEFSERSSEKSLNSSLIWVFPAPDYPAYSAHHILRFLEERVGNEGTVPKLVIIGFSAGVVGAIGAAWAWRLLGRTVKAFIAIDGWGVPLYGDFPIYRLSHDHFTHWSSSLLGSGVVSFYADPAVSHLNLWRMPNRVNGWQVGDRVAHQRLTAAEFITEILQRHGEIDENRNFSIVNR